MLEVEQGVNDKINDIGELKKIEVMARICYKSSKNMTEDSHKEMIKNLIKNQHYAMLEHANYVYSTTSRGYYEDMLKVVESLEHTYLAGNSPEVYKCYLRFTKCDIPTSRMNINRRFANRNERFVISGNLRAWLEFFKECDNQVTDFDTTPTVVSMFYHTLMRDAFKSLDINPYPRLVDEHLSDYNLFKPFDVNMKGTIEERLVHETFSVIFTTDRGVANELVRHRPASFAQESTRYVNYTKADDIEFIKPFYFEEHSSEITAWRKSCRAAEDAYFILIDNLKATPQQARAVLPLCTKTIIGVTATLAEWQHILDLRYLEITGPAHPQMKELMKKLMDTCIQDYEGILDFE